MAHYSCFPQFHKLKYAHILAVPIKTVLSLSSNVQSYLMKCSFNSYMKTKGTMDKQLSIVNKHIWDKTLQKMDEKKEVY